MSKIQIGLARNHLEPGEKRDFLPDFVRHLHEFGADLLLEHGYGAGLGLSEADYRSAVKDIQFASLDQIYQQDMVVVLRYPGDHLVSTMRPGSCLVSMLHYPTRPNRVALLHKLGVQGISLDSIKDDVGRRLVENLRAVGWNGLEAAFKVLESIYPAPGLVNPNRNPIKVTVLGAGSVGMYAIQASVRYGNEQTWRHMASEGVTGVQTTVVEYDLTNHPTIMTQILKYTDILVDATQRKDTSRPIIPNEWIGLMRPYAVLLDLSVDPYECTPDGVQMVKGIEGMPQGNLDQYVFAPDDPVYDTLPGCVRRDHRRWAVSCYSWPGIHPYECMQVYGKQLEPVLQAVLAAGGVDRLSPEGDFFERAAYRALLP